jgi:tetratricopeptide (TPR) repeat protein
MALARLNRPDEAQHQLAEAVRLDPQRITWQALGGLRKSLGDADGAEQAYREALRFSPKEVSVLNDLGILQAELGRLDRAVSYFEQAIAIEPRYYDAVRNLAVALEQSGLHSASLPVFERAIRMNPNDGSVRYGLARALGLAGRYREAIIELGEAISLDPNQPEWLGALAWIHATHPDPSLRDGSAAVRLAERASAVLQDREPTALAVRAAAYAEVGRYASATSTLGLALTLLPPEDTATRNALRAQLEVYARGEPFRDTAAVSPGP